MRTRRVVAPRAMQGVSGRTLGLLFALTVLWGMPSVAAARWYQVEVVVFRQPQSTDTGGETLAHMAALPNLRREVRLVAELPEMSDEPAPLSNEPEQRTR